MRMLNEQVLVTEVKKETTTASGIILSGSTSKAAQPALVLAVGPDVDGIEKGDRVYLEWPKSMAVDWNGSPAAIIDSCWIKAVL